MSREMTDSGVEWIGEIPEEWKVVKLNKLCSIITGNTPDRGKQSCYYSNTDGVPWIKAENLGEGQSISHTAEYLTDEGCNVGRVFPPNTVYVCCIASVGKVGYSMVSASCNQQINALMFNNLYDWKYGYYVTLTQQEEYDIQASGNVMKIINSDKQKRLMCPLPHIDEQKKIVSFLDKQCAQIDYILEKTQASIGEYKTLKQAVITEAVSKGVYEECGLRESGVEWLGRIPKDWNIQKGKQLFKETNERSVTGEEELLTVSHITGVTPRKNKNVNMFMSESLVDYKICHEGDVAANTMWMWQGAIGVSKYYGVISPSYNTYRQKADTYDADYLEYLLRIPPLVATYAAYSTGITASRLRLYPQGFFSILFPVPPRKEQQEIAVYLNKKIPQIDQLIIKKEKFVDELKSYKRSLIYEYVTGKKEVPEF